LGLFVRIGPTGDYLTQVLPAITVLGLGLAVTVAPLTATVLAAVPPQHAGIASAVNNDNGRRLPAKPTERTAASSLVH
jgi:hypothetical protein